MRLKAARRKNGTNRNTFLCFLAAVFASLFLLAPVSAQDDDAVQDYPKLDERITEETDDQYNYLLHYVFPDAKSAKPGDNSLDAKENAATRSIRLRRLFGSGFSKLNERRLVTIKQTRWLQARGRQKFLVVLFEAPAPENQKTAKKTFYTLAIFRYVRMRVPDFSVFSATKWKWTYIFDFVDAVDPQLAADVELPKTLPTIKDWRGGDAFWILDSRAAGSETFKNYSAVELYNERLRPLLKDFLSLYSNSDCAHRFEQNLEAFSQLPAVKSVLSFEINIVSKIWMSNDCRALETVGDLRETESYQPRWQVRSRRRQLVRFQLLDKKVEKIEHDYQVEITGIPDCDDYLEKYEICLRTKLYRGTANRAETEKYLTMLRETWKKSFASVEKSETTAAACRQARETARESLNSFGCEW
jgi:hypothetical protein